VLEIGIAQDSPQWARSRPKPMDRNQPARDFRMGGTLRQIFRVSLKSRIRRLYGSRDVLEHVPVAELLGDNSLAATIRTRRIRCRRKTNPV
jgi:hypothetical protein